MLCTIYFDMVLNNNKTTFLNYRNIIIGQNFGSTNKINNVPLEYVQHLKYTDEK